jgi:hypothetical protein
VKHKLTSSWSETLERKIWHLACGADLEGKSVVTAWQNVKCKECFKFRKRRKKRL